MGIERGITSTPLFVPSFPGMDTTLWYSQRDKDASCKALPTPFHLFTTLSHQLLHLHPDHYHSLVPTTWPVVGQRPCSPLRQLVLMSCH